MSEKPKHLLSVETRLDLALEANATLTSSLRVIKMALAGLGLYLPQNSQARLDVASLYGQAAKAIEFAETTFEAIYAPAPDQEEIPGEPPKLH